MSLFGHLAVRFGSHPENLATEALGYVLTKSAAARRGFVSSLGKAAEQLTERLRFETQHADEDAGRPDLAAFDETGKLALLVEAKFWAGFTENQPVGYLKLLPPSGVLLVVCPDERLDLVWIELLKRIGATSLAVDARVRADDERHIICEGRHLVLQSWRRLLGAIRLELSGEPSLLADVAQLDGLCERMDSEAFIPVTSEELTSQVFRRVHEFGQIVDELVAKLSAEGIVSTKGYRASAGNGWYGRSLEIRGAYAVLQVSTWKWTKFAPSPVWLTVYGATWRGDRTPAKQRLAQYEVLNPGTVYVDHAGAPTVMLRVPTGADRPQVVETITAQLRELSVLLAGLRTVGPAEPPPEPEAGPDDIGAG